MLCHAYNHSCYYSCYYSCYKVRAITRAIIRAISRAIQFTVWKGAESTCDNKINIFNAMLYTRYILLIDSESAEFYSTVMAKLKHRWLESIRLLVKVIPVVPVAPVAPVDPVDPVAPVTGNFEVLF